LPPVLNRNTAFMRRLGGARTVLGNLKKFEENSVDDRREGSPLLICNALQFHHFTIGD